MILGPPMWKALQIKHRRIVNVDWTVYQIIIECSKLFQKEWFGMNQWWNWSNGNSTSEGILSKATNCKCTDEKCSFRTKVVKFTRTLRFKRINKFRFEYRVQKWTCQNWIPLFHTWYIWKEVRIYENISTLT